MWAFFWERPADALRAIDMWRTSRTWRRMNSRWRCRILFTIKAKTVGMGRRRAGRIVNSPATAFDYANADLLQACGLSSVFAVPIAVDGEVQQVLEFFRSA